MTGKLSLWRRAAVFGLAACAAVAAAPAQAQRAEPCIGMSMEVTGPLANQGLMLRIALETALDQHQRGRWGARPPAPPGDLRRRGRACPRRGQCAAASASGTTASSCSAASARPTPSRCASRSPRWACPGSASISAGTGVIEHPNGRNEWMFRVSMKDRWVARIPGRAGQGAQPERPDRASSTRAPPGARARCPMSRRRREATTSRSQGARPSTSATRTCRRR